MTRRPSIPILLLIAALASLPAPAGAQVTLRNIQMLSHFNDYPPGLPTDDAYSACWAYIHSDGREYAVIGTYSGTAFYNITNPAAAYKVGFIAGPPSIWREMKSYRDWVYIVSEGSGTGRGLQVVRMTNPEAPTLVTTYTTNFVTSHTVSVDTARAILVCNGTRNSSGQATGMRVLSLANPEAPVQVGWWPGGTVPVSTTNYIHDCEPFGNRLYGSSIYVGIQRVFDFSNPAAITQTSQWTYPSAFYCHSAWPDSSGTRLYVCDEQAGQTLRVFDISSLTAPPVVNEITSNPIAIVHNPRVKGQELYLANYTEGIRVLDISDPLHPAEFAYADSWAGPSGDFYGVWECCPYFPSGTVIASDLQSGLYVYSVQRNYGIIRAKVVDQSSGLPLQGIKVYLTSQGDSLTTPADGVVQFAPSPGSHTVQAWHAGYAYGSAAVNVSVGSRDTVVLSIPTGTLSGVVREAGTMTPLEDAEVTLSRYPTAAHTDATGAYAYGALPADVYSVAVRAPGHIPALFTRNLGPVFGGQDFVLAPAPLWDALESNTGWVVGAAGDDATTGIWVRVDPVGSGAPQAGPARAERVPVALASGSAPVAAAAGRGRSAEALDHHPIEGEGDFAPGDVQPENDRTPPPGIMCFVTGQGVPGAGVGDNDVDNGHTSLTSPAFDVSAMTDPVLGYWRWFYTRDADGSDYFAVQISSDGGTSWLPVTTTYTNAARWSEQAIRIKDFIPSPTTVKVRFVAADDAPGGIVEAAVDDIVTYEAGTPAVSVGPAAGVARLAFAAPRPNPASGRMLLALELPAAGDVRVEVLDLLGRRVRALHDGRAAAGTLALQWNGADDRGAALPAGLYFARATMASRTAVTRLMRLR